MFPLTRDSIYSPSLTIIRDDEAWAESLTYQHGSQITWVSPEQSPAPRHYLNDRYNIITSNTGGALITSLSHTFIQSNHSEKPAPENHASWEPDKMRMVSWTRWLAADSWLWKLLYWSNCSEIDGKKPLLMWSMAWQSDYSLGLMFVVTNLSGSIEY